jgi:hypothetical protein
MPSSTSSSESWRVEPPPILVPFDRPLPALRFGIATIVAAIVFIGSIVGWELYWRAWGATPSYQNSDGLWAMQRRRIDHDEGNATVLSGASRILFDVDLDTWQRVSGERPIQLALEGTSPLFLLEDLANDSKFKGRLIVDVAPDLFFTGFEYRGKAQKYYREETLSQKAGQWLSMHFVEPFFAFYDPDFALFTVLKRQHWPARAGVPPRTDVRKLAMIDADRNTRMWVKVEQDHDYQKLAQDIWAEDFDVPPYKVMKLSGPEEMQRVIDKQIDRAATAVSKLRALGVEVIFVRPPSDARYLEFENREFPRSKTWEVLLQRAGAPGIHFEDYPELQGYWLPEWSHLAAEERPRFTEALYGILEREYGWPRLNAKKEN